MRDSERIKDRIFVLCNEAASLADLIGDKGLSVLLMGTALLAAGRRRKAPPSPARIRRKARSPRKRAIKAVRSA